MHGLILHLKQIPVLDVMILDQKIKNRLFKFPGDVMVSSEKLLFSSPFFYRRRFFQRRSTFRAGIDFNLVGLYGAKNISHF
jgi:hypothetical protein